MLEGLDGGWVGGCVCVCVCGGGGGGGGGLVFTILHLIKILGYSLK